MELACTVCLSTPPLSPRRFFVSILSDCLLSFSFSLSLSLLQLFGRDDAFHARLRQVLEAYTCSRPDLGYIQGMSYLAAMLSLYARDSFEAFKCLANMMVSSTIITI